MPKFKMKSNNGQQITMSDKNKFLKQIKNQAKSIVEHMAGYANMKDAQKARMLKLQELQILEGYKSAQEDDLTTLQTGTSTANPQDIKEQQELVDSATTLLQEQTEIISKKQKDDDTTYGFQESINAQGKKTWTIDSMAGYDGGQQADMILDAAKPSDHVNIDFGNPPKRGSMWGGVWGIKNEKGVYNTTRICTNITRHLLEKPNLTLSRITQKGADGNRVNLYNSKSPLTEQLEAIKKGPEKTLGIFKKQTTTTPNSPHHKGARIALVLTAHINSRAKQFSTGKLDLKDSSGQDLPEVKFLQEWTKGSPKTRAAMLQDIVAPTGTSNNTIDYVESARVYIRDNFNDDIKGQLDTTIRLASGQALDPKALAKAQTKGDDFGRFRYRGWKWRVPEIEVTDTTNIQKNGKTRLFNQFSVPKNLNSWYRWLADNIGGGSNQKGIKSYGERQLTQLRDQQNALEEHVQELDQSIQDNSTLRSASNNPTTQKKSFDITERNLLLKKLGCLRRARALHKKSLNSNGESEILTTVQRINQLAGAINKSQPNAPTIPSIQVPLPPPPPNAKQTNKSKPNQKVPTNSSLRVQRTGGAKQRVQRNNPRDQRTGEAKQRVDETEGAKQRVRRKNPRVQRKRGAKTNRKGVYSHRNKRKNNTPLKRYQREQYQDSGGGIKSTSKHRLKTTHTQVNKQKSIGSKGMGKGGNSGQ